MLTFFVISDDRCGIVALNVTIKSYSTIVKFSEHMIRIPVIRCISPHIIFNAWVKLEFSQISKNSEL